MSLPWSLESLASRPTRGGGGCSRERQRGGKKAGGAKPHEETPHEKQFATPLTSVRVAPPCPISLSKKFPEFPSADLLGNHFRRVSKSGFRRAILARFCFSVRFAPPRFSSAQVFSATTPSAFLNSNFSQRRRDDNKNKICTFFWGGGGIGGQRGKSSKNACFRGKRHDNKI